MEVLTRESVTEACVCQLPHRCEEAFMAKRVLESLLPMWRANAVLKLLACQHFVTEDDCCFALRRVKCEVM